MGAAVAGHVAATVPERVTALVLAAPVGYAGVPLMPLFRALTPSFAVPLLPWLAPRMLIRFMLGAVFGRLRRPSRRDVDEFWAPTQFPDFTRSLRHLLHEFGWKEDFPPLAMPWMTIVGTRDWLSPADEVSRYSGAGRAAPNIVIEDAGHVLFCEAPESVNRALIDFFGEPRKAGYISTQHE